MEMCNIENKHTSYDLKQMQSLPLEQKIQMTKNRIREWYEHWDGQVYVSFSGGKDSTVLKHIVDSMYKDVPALFVNTGLEYPEIQRFVKDVKAGKFSCFNSDVEIVRPEMRFDEVILKYGYPVISKRVAGYASTAKRNPDSARAKYLRGDIQSKMFGFGNGKYAYLIDAPFRISDYCCEVMKKRPNKNYAKRSGRYPFLGTMASESIQRRNNWMIHGCNGFNQKEPHSIPISFWTEQDVLQYIKQFDVPYCSVYGDIVSDEKTGKLKTTGCSRTGCIFCMFGAHLEKEPNRFQRLKETHPRQYEYCIQGGNGLMENGNQVQKGLDLVRCWIS